MTVDQNDGRGAECERASAADSDGGSGYGRPPKRTRFQPGRSGNPKGRPRRARSRAQIIKEVANEVHDVVENGKRCRRPTLEVALLVIRGHAFKGNLKAFRELEALLGRFDPQVVGKPAGYLFVPPPLETIEEVEAAAARLNEWQKTLPKL